MILDRKLLPARQPTCTSHIWCHVANAKPSVCEKEKRA